MNVNGGFICNNLKWETLTPWKESYDQPRQHIKKQGHYFANKGPSSQGYGFPVVMYGCESWTTKKAECWSTDTSEWWFGQAPWQSLGPQGDQISQSKGNSSWVLIGRTDVEAETPKLWPPDVKSWFIGKDPDAGKDWRREEKGTTGWVVGWHHWLNGHEFD